MFAALTGAGLSAAAGLNAYIPFLVVALFSRFTDAMELPGHFAWIESNWAIGTATVLLLAEVVFDKVPVVDHINDLIGTIIRPASGGLIFSASQAAGDFEAGSDFLADNSWVGVAGGVAIAGAVHGGKAATRAVVNGASFGLGAPVVSTAEDGTSVGLSLLAIFAPVLVIFALIAMVWVGFAIWSRRKTKRNRAEQEQEFAARRASYENRGPAPGDHAAQHPPR